MKDIERGPLGKRRFRMDYISNKQLFKAVMFARSMMRKGTSPARANHVAASYYGFSTEQVAHYTGQCAGTTAGRRRAR
jgi:hypothetical protein